MKEVTITRKIQLLFDSDDKKQRDEYYKTLYRWQKIVFKSANMIATHHFIQEQVKDIVYFTDEVKIKLANIKKDENGILSTSKQNTTYQMLSKQFKGDIPMAIITSLNSQIVSVFNKEKTDYFRGNKSLRNYKSNLPIPIQSRDMNNITEIEKKNYSFTLYGINFKTFFGKDLSDNKSIFKKGLSGEYKLCDSSILIDKGKIFLLAVFQFDKLKVRINKDIIAKVNLNINHPLTVSIKKKVFNIGNKEEYLHRRLAIQSGLRRAQISSTFNKGGKGIHKKTSAINRYKKAEVSYIESRIHAYTAKLINICLKYNVGVIELENIEEVVEKTKENDFLLRNWSYYGLKEKIKYKSNKYGIELIG